MKFVYITKRGYKTLNSGDSILLGLARKRGLKWFKLNHREKYNKLKKWLIS